MKARIYFSNAVVCLIVGLSYAQPAWSRSCWDNPNLAWAGGMMPQLYPKWDPDPALYGAPIRSLFTRDGACEGCHTVTASYVGMSGERFPHCMNCHDGSPDQGSPGDLRNWAMAAPPWLDFTKKEVLMSGSYYLPGHTKAEAALVRSRDGTMPPGAVYHDNEAHKDVGVGGYLERVSWCQEIQDAVQAWIDAGYP